MRKLTLENITDRVVDSFANCDSPRLKEIMQMLVRHLHTFAREAKLSREEWHFGIDFLYRAGAISDDKRNEFMGFSDSLGLSTLVEFMNQRQDGRTPVNLLGPFYVEDAPPLSFNANLRAGFPGDPLVLRGRVLDLQSNPIANARINMWQTQEDGLYDVQIPELKEYRFRGWLQTGTDGVFQVRTIRPTGYTAPMDGPLGKMLIETKRNEWRPAHWHFLIKAEGYQSLVTELYPSDSPHLDDDVAFGPRPDLLVDVKKIEDKEEAKRFDIPSPFFLVEYDFKLAQV